jgi:glycosyltransferase involved in cell wall biosynthesis
MPSQTPPQRILHVVRPAEGGIRQHVLELIRHTDRDHFSLAVAAPAHFLHSLPQDLPPFTQLALEISPQFALTQDLVAITRLAQMTRKADRIHAHGLRAALIAAGALRLQSLPLIITAHNIVPQGRLSRLAVQIMQGRSPQWIAISGAVVKSLTAQGVANERIEIIPNGIDLNYFAAISPAPQPIPTVGCIARLSPEKGVDLLVKAAALLPHIHFLIAGDGPERRTLMQQAPENVNFIGRIEDTRQVYGKADLIAIPSRQEGQGLVALEAMASGVPLVASRVGGLAEMLADKETALLTAPEDPEGLAKAIEALINDKPLREKLQAQGRKLVQERYDIRQMIQATEKVYRKAGR